MGELIDLMAANGCIGFFFGIDSGSNRVQSLIRKRLDLAEAMKVSSQGNTVSLRGQIGAAAIEKSLKQ